MNKHHFNFALPIISAIALPISSIAYSANPPSAIDVLSDKLQEINTLQGELNKQLDELRTKQSEIEQQRQLEIQNAELSGQVKALQQQVKELKQSELIEQRVNLLKELKLQRTEGTIVTGQADMWSPTSECPVGHIVTGLARIDLHGPENQPNVQVNDFSCDNSGCRAWCAGSACTVIAQCIKL